MVPQHFDQFFEMFDGKIKEPTTKPCLNDDGHICDRLHWAILQKQKQRTRSRLRKGFICRYLDEKLFYITSKRHKVKFLPANRLEDAAKVFQSQPKTHSRRFPTKVMMMGVISKPYPEHNFDGKIMLKRVSQWFKTKRVSYSQKKF